MFLCFLLTFISFISLILNSIIDICLAPLSPRHFPTEKPLHSFIIEIISIPETWIYKICNIPILYYRIRNIHIRITVIVVHISFFSFYISYAYASAICIHCVRKHWTFNVYCYCHFVCLALNFFFSLMFPLLRFFFLSEWMAFLLSNYREIVNVDMHRSIVKTICWKPFFFFDLIRSNVSTFNRKMVRKWIEWSFCKSQSF